MEKQRKKYLGANTFISLAGNTNLDILKRNCETILCALHSTALRELIPVGFIALSVPTSQLNVYDML